MLIRARANLLQKLSSEASTWQPCQEQGSRNPGVRGRFCPEKQRSASQAFCLSLRLGSPLHHLCDPVRLRTDQREDPLEGAGPERAYTHSLVHGVGRQHVEQGLLPGEGDTAVLVSC